MFFNLKKHQNRASHTTAGSLETGRTMTEMLGTLAIIGVLSIGGIAGYSYAMDKYRANTTVNEINMRMVDLITQASQGNTLSLVEWGQTSTVGYTFSNPEWTDSGTIALKVSGLSKGVCEMVSELLGERFDVEVHSSDTSTCGDNSDVTVFFESTGAGVTCTPACGEGEVCDGGICMDIEAKFEESDNFSCVEDRDCPECQTCSSDSCQNVADGTTCSVGTCQSGLCQGDLCSDNDACPLGSFCADSNASCTSANPTQCKKLEVVLKKITLSNGTSEAWYMSRRMMSWWDAQSFCSRLGKTMVTVDDLLSGWSGSSYGYGTLTERAQKLYDMLGGEPWIFTSNIAPSNSCYAFGVRLDGSYAVSEVRNHYSLYFALCH